MTITPPTYPVIPTGLSRPTQPAPPHQEPKPPVLQPTSQVPLSPPPTQRIRQTINAHAMQDQNLTHQGSRAKDIYQDIEQSTEGELMPRLNVVA